MQTLKLTVTAGLGQERQVRAAPRTSFRAAVPHTGFARQTTRGDSVMRHMSVDESGILSGEWPVTWSLASYDDLSTYFQNKFFKEDTAQTLAFVMSANPLTTTADAPLDAVRATLTDISGLPVVDSNGTLVGVVSRKDLDKPGARVSDVMTTSPVALKGSNKVQDAAAAMLKHKVHRIPIVDDKARCIGIVTRTDIFTALAMDTL
jgi:CBS domain-containing protein